MKVYKQFEPQGLRDGFLCGTVSLMDDKPSLYSRTLAIARLGNYEAHIQVTETTFKKMLKDRGRWRAVYSHCGVLAKQTVASLVRFETRKPIEGKPSLEWVT